MANYYSSLKFILVLLFINATLLAQSKFLPGKITKTNGETIAVLIKVTSWKNNPKAIQYKLQNETKITTSTVVDISGFEVFNKAKYLRADVAFDRSSDLQGQLSFVRDPIWENEILFLKVLVESEVSLYLHKTNNTMRFYYQKGSGSFEPLVYKKYLSGQRVQRNRAYRKQIQDNFLCGYEIDGLRKLEYKIKDMVKLFKSINECAGNEVNIMQSEGAKGTTNWAFQPGINFISGNMTKTLFATGGTVRDFYVSDIENKSALRIGFEGEYMMPHSLNKWALFFGAAYTSFKSQGEWNDVLFAKDFSFQRGTQKWDATISHVTINIGLRRYIYVNDKFRILASLGWVPGLSLNLNSSVDVGLINGTELFSGADLETREVSNFIAGLGIQTGRATLEVRYNTKRKVLADNVVYDLSYQSISIMIGFNFLKNLKK